MGVLTKECKACATQEDCATGEICDVEGASRRGLRFGVRQDGCCSAPVAV